MSFDFGAQTVKRLAIVGALLVPLCGCSVAALVQENSLETRMTALEARVHALEMQQTGMPQTVKP